MKRLEDVQAKLSHHWAVLCTAQRVRESVTLSLMGIRVHLLRQDIDIFDVQKSCIEVRRQLELLVTRGDERHARMLSRVLEHYEQKVGALLESRNARADSQSVEAGK